MVASIKKLVHSIEASNGAFFFPANQKNFVLLQ